MTMKANERRSLVIRAQRRTHQHGAAMVEYSLLLFAVLICGAAAIKKIGPAVACGGANATDSLSGGSGGGCEGATASPGAGGASGGSSGGSSGTTAGSTSGGSSAAADEGAAGGAGSGSGYLASSSSYDDGAGGFIGGSGSSNRGSGNPNAPDMEPGSAPPSNASSFSGVSASGSASNGSSGSSGASGSGSSSSASSGGGGGGGGRGSGEINGPEDQYASEGNKFASQVAGKKPEQIDMTFAKLDANTDGFNGKTPTKGADGFVVASKQQLANAGITQSMLVDKGDGFAAQVFTDNKGDYVVAYRGTQFPSLGQALTDPTSVGGIAADVGQGAGLGLHTREFAEAVRLAQAAKTAYGGNVVFTGHSLGGGLAATSAMATGLPAVTYNASGVNDKTLQDLGLNPAAARAQAANGQIKNYEVDHEILSTEQNAPGSILPPALGSTVAIKDPNPGLTEADAKNSSIFNPGPILSRGFFLHGDVVGAMKANPTVTYPGADGTTQSFKFSDPSH